LKRKILIPLIPDIFFLAILLCLPAIVSAQGEKKYPQNYFRWPVNIKPEIVANLGELRPNHWHMGLDIRTAQRVNMPVYAAAGGYIARIGIRSQSFGRFIVINHPNGFSTLYAHLNNFFPALEKYVTEQQYKIESWAIELDIPKEKFPVSKSQFIAYSGTTGGSQGPHVHFEIRNTSTDECLNPLLFGLPLQDKVRPVLLKLALYDRSRSIYEQAPQFFILKNTADGYIISKSPVIRTGLNKISFGIQAFDRISGSQNEDGIYAAKLFFDEQPVTGFLLDSIGYGETGYLNAHIDYKYRYNGGAFFQLLSSLPGDRSGIYHSANGDEVINLQDTDLHTIRIEVRDAYHNVSQLNFSIQYKDDLAQPLANQFLAQQFLPNYVNVLEKPDFEIYLPETCLYDTLRSYYFRNNLFPEYSVSAMHQVNDPSVPVHGELTVRIKPDKMIPAEWKDKIVIQRNYRNGKTSRKAEWDGAWLSSRFGDFGNFQAFTDIIPPSLNELGRGDTVNLSAATRIMFQPTDNFGIIKSFRAELDGRWLRFTNDKGRSYIYIFDERCPYGVHTLKVKVEDLVGNVTTKTWWFKKYPYTPPKKSKKVSGKKRVASGKKKTTTKRK
jgi:hypothetical protein